MAANCCQRRAQLVRDGHQEVPLELLRLREPGRHLPERVGQVGDLVAPGHVRNGYVVIALRDLIGRLGQTANGPRDPSREVPGKRCRDEQADEQGDRHALEQPGDLVAQLSLRRRHHESPERKPLLLEVQRMRDGEELPVLSGRDEGELERSPAQERRIVDRLLRQLPQAKLLARERPEAHVVEPVAARALELRAHEERRRLVLLLRPQCLLGVELGQPRGLAAQLSLGLVLGVVPEEPEGDRGRDDRGQRDPGEEERRQSEAQRAEHSFAARPSRSPSRARPCTPRPTP